MKFVESIIIALVQGSRGPLDRKRILEDAAAIAEMEAIRYACLGEDNLSRELQRQAKSCTAAAERLAKGANSFLNGAGGRH